MTNRNGYEAQKKGSSVRTSPSCYSDDGHDAVIVQRVMISELSWFLLCKGDLYFFLLLLVAAVIVVVIVYAIIIFADALILLAAFNFACNSGSSSSNPLDGQSNDMASVSRAGSPRQ